MIVHRMYKFCFKKQNVGPACDEDKAMTEVVGKQLLWGGVAVNVVTTHKHYQRWIVTTIQEGTLLLTHEQIQTEE